MIPDDIRKLLGGYATGTLTDEERNLLFSAALQDQELFDALADEEALRELLAQPGTRQTLLAQLQPQPAYAVSQAPTQVRTEMPRWWDRFTPLHLGMATAFALVLLIAGGIQYKRLHAPEATIVASVNPALDHTAPFSVPAQAPPPSAVQRSAAPSEAATRAADARASNAIEPDGAAKRNEENPAAPPAIAPAADSERRKTEKDTADSTLAREQLNQAVRDQVARRQVAQGASAGAAGFGDAVERPSAPISPSQIVTGGLRSAGAPPPPPPPPPPVKSVNIDTREIDARVTDINGTIVSINAGSNAGLRAGDVIEIVRDNRVLATSKLSQVGANFSVGPLQRAAGSPDSPQSGDTVRRAR